MWLLAPLTLGLGTVVLWLLALRWPRRIDRDSLTLRSGRQVPWAAIRKIAVLKDARVDESRPDWRTSSTNSVPSAKSRRKPVGPASS